MKKGPKRKSAKKPSEEVLAKIRMDLFLGKQSAQICRRYQVSKDVVAHQMDLLECNGVGIVSRGQLDPYPMLSATQAALVSCISSRRIRALANEGRIFSNTPSGQHMITTTSLKEFLAKPRASGVPGQKLIHGDRWENPYASTKRK